MIRNGEVYFSLDQLIRFGKNIGYDFSCGACAELFFTGYREAAHNEDCKTKLPHKIDSVRLKSDR